MALTGVDVRSFELVAGEDIEVEVELAVSRFVTTSRPSRMSHTEPTITRGKLETLGFSRVRPSYTISEAITDRSRIEMFLLQRRIALGIKTNYCNVLSRTSSCYCCLVIGHQNFDRVDKHPQPIVFYASPQLEFEAFF